MLHRLRTVGLEIWSNGSKAMEHRRWPRCQAEPWSIIDSRGVRPRTGFLTACSWGGDNETLSVGLDRALGAASSRRRKSFGTPFGHRDTLEASAHSDSLTSRQQKISHTAVTNQPVGSCS